MTELCPLEAAARGVVDHLQEAGFDAYFVGGCVRDQLLGREPREYDVSTSAEPGQVQQVFERTFDVGGGKFGVIVVVTDAGNVEVATFRSDDAYVDGRRPTGVRFSSAEEDAQRRDFTVNGLFLNPATGEILDYVGGRADLDARILRAIGDPRRRFAEDKLRLLRAVRFATTGPFQIERETWDAMGEMASEIGVVSQERIREEISKIVVSGRSAHGFRLLQESGLLQAILPELEATRGVEQPPEFHPEGDVWVHTMLAMEHYDASHDRSLELGLATLLHDVGKPPTFEVADRIRFNGHDRVGAEMASDILRRLRYPNAVIDQVEDLVRRHMAFVQIREWREAKLRRFTTHEWAERHLELHRIDCLASHGQLDTWKWVGERRQQFLSEPPPPVRMVNGNDLLAAGYPQGRIIGKALASIEDEILEGRLTTKEEALAWVIREMPPDMDAG